MQSWRRRRRGWLSWSRIAPPPPHVTNTHSSLSGTRSMLLRVACGVVVAALRAQATELQASATEAQGKSERLEAELATLRQAAEAAGEEQGGALAKLVRKKTAMVLLLS